MTPRVWSTEEIRAFTAGRRVELRDGALHQGAVPAWILGPGAEPGTRSIAERMARIHLDDVPVLTAASFDAHDRPGEVVECTYRIRDDDTWVREAGLFLSLLHQPEVAGVIALTEVLEVLGAVEADERKGWAGTWKHARWAFEVLDVQSTILQVEGMVEEIFGTTADELVGTSVVQFIAEEDVADGVAMWIELLQRPGSTASAIQQLRRPDGTTIWIESMLVNRPQPDGSTEIINVIHDITERREQELALRQLADEFRLVAEEVPAGVFRCDPTGALTFHNERWGALAGDARVERLHDLFDRAEHARVDEELATSAAAGSAPGERPLLELRAAAPGRTLTLRLRPVGAAGSDRLSFVGSVEDVTDTVRLREQALRDPLTGLLNRRGLEQHLAEVLAGPVDDVLVVFLDLDGFKAVNDDHGHDVGDRVLTAVAARLAGQVRADDVVGRFGGDEFVLVCRDVAPDEDAGLVHRFERDLAEPIEWDGGSWVPRGSLGHARPTAGERLDDLIRRADHAMLDEKRRHRLRTPSAPERAS